MARLKKETDDAKQNLASESNTSADHEKQPIKQTEDSKCFVFFSNQRLLVFF